MRSTSGNSCVSFGHLNNVPYLFTFLLHFSLIPFLQTMFLPVVCLPSILCNHFLSTFSFPLLLLSISFFPMYTNKPLMLPYTCIMCFGWMRETGNRQGAKWDGKPMQSGLNYTAQKAPYWWIADVDTLFFLLSPSTLLPFNETYFHSLVS